MIPRALIAAALVLVAPGCCATRSPITRMTSVQQDAIQVRDVEAPPDRVYSAAVGALLDAGYTIEVSDSEGGLLMGIRRHDPSIAEHAIVLAISTYLTYGSAPMPAPPRFRAVCVQVLPRPGGLSSMRICLYGHANLKREEAIIDDLWILVQRDLLARSAAPAVP